jgi:tRNA (cmo5U34)-methyltransferase
MSASSSPSLPSTPQHFDQQQAANYETRWAPLAPLRESLHLQMRLLLHGLPSAARVLCVGAGTGAELLALARAFPGWRFTAVDPSAPMLEVCRQLATEAGVADRCEFHACYAHELPPGETYDAATSILVSHFITDRAKRVAYYRELASRLRPSGWLVTADLTASPPDQHGSLYAVWQQMMRYAGSTEEQIQAMHVAYQRDVAMPPAPEMEALLAEAGFVAPVHFSQSLLIHAWFARKQI